MLETVQNVILAIVGLCFAIELYLQKNPKNKNVVSIFSYVGAGFAAIGLVLLVGKYTFLN